MYIYCFFFLCKMSWKGDFWPSFEYLNKPNNYLTGIPHPLFCYYYMSLTLGVSSLLQFMFCARVVFVPVFFFSCLSFFCWFCWRFLPVKSACSYNDFFQTDMQFVWNQFYPPYKAKTLHLKIWQTPSPPKNLSSCQNKNIPNIAATNISRRLCMSHRLPLIMQLFSTAAAGMYLEIPAWVCF